jgi:hypothetical protein
VDLGHTQRRTRKPFAKVRDVLTNKIAGRRDQANVRLLFEHRIDRHAQHDFGFAGLDEFMGQRDRLCIAVDGRPDLVL